MQRIFSLLFPAFLWAGTVKVAFLHHGNQHFSDNGAYALRPGDPGYVGNSYHRTLDTHFYYQVPVDIHISGPLVHSYAWNQNDNGLLSRLQNSLVDIVGGTYAEHIMPYVAQEMNEFSTWFARQVYDSLIKGPGQPDQPTVIWIPERVWKSENLMPYSLIAVLNTQYGKTDSQGRWIPPVIVLDDNVHGWYPHSYPDGTPCNNPFKVHQMFDSQGNRVFVVFISSTARNQWVWNNVSDPGNPLHQLLWAKANDPDQEQLVLYADDWEKAAGVAGWDFGHPGAPANSYDANIAWAASQSWIQFVHIGEVAKWWGVDRIYDTDPLNDPPTIQIDYAAYPELHGWTGGNYDYWYGDFQDTQGYETGLGPDLNGNGVQGDYEDLWKWGDQELMGVPDNRIAKVGWATLMSLLYETAWHTGPGGVLVDWGRNLWNHSRYAGGFAFGAWWLDQVTGGSLTGTHIRVQDFDGDGIEEYALYNDQICAIFDRRGGRALWLFTADGDVIIGNLLSNWGGEGDWDDGGHLGLFQDSQAENSWFNVSVDTSFAPDSVSLTLSEAYDAGGNPSTDLSKTVVLATGRSYLEARYTSTWDNWTKAGVSPDLLTILFHGYTLAFIQGLTPNGWTYAGYANTHTGAKGVFLWASGQGLTYHNLGKLAGGAEKIELGGRSGTYTLYFYAGRGDPEVAGQGPGDLEGPVIYDGWQSPDYQIQPSDSVQIVRRVVDPSGVAWCRIHYGVDGNWSFPDIEMWEDDGGTYDWDGDGQPDPGLYGGYIPPQNYGSTVEYDVYASDGAGNVTWDNNYGQNYRYVVGFVIFRMDGELDRVARLVAQNGGMHLWVYYDPDSTWLYVATEAAGDDGSSGFANDHFIFLSLNPQTLVAAPWAKAGQVGQWFAFLADENDNNFAGWFDDAQHLVTDTTKVLWAAGSREGIQVLEGAIRLDRFLGNPPGSVYIAVGSYETWDGGSLQWQVPPPQTVNGDIEADEFLQYPTPTGVAERRTPQGLPPSLTVFGGKVRLVLDRPAEVALRLYRADGRQVAVLLPRVLLSPGVHRFSLPRGLPSGLYFLRLQAGSGTGVQKVLVVQ